MHTRAQPIGLPHRVIARAAAVTGLLGMALIHLLDLQSKFEETPYLGVCYLALIVGSLACAGALVHRDSERTWLAAGALAVGAIVAFAVSRTTGLPLATDDIGNWLEPLGLAALFVEGITAAVCTYALADGVAMARQADAPERAGALQSA
jgi:hypothetical protein